MNSINVIIRASYTKQDGSKPVYLQVTNSNRRTKIYSLNVSVEEKLWNVKTQRISDKAINAKEDNSKIDSFYEKANKFVFQANYENKCIDVKFHNVVVEIDF